MIMLTTSSLGLFYVFSYNLQRRGERKQGQGPKTLAVCFKLGLGMARLDIACKTCPAD